MQKAPVMKGSGLKPLKDENSSDQPVHVFGSNLQERVITKDEGEESPASSFCTIQETKKEDDIDTIRKRKFDAITGEEDEETAFQGDFKLFAWDLDTSNWVEKGRGQLKLNDSRNQDRTQSRIIMRVAGTLKIILNVAIRRKTFKVIANTKTSIRFTDSQTVWAASGNNAEQLRELIDDRIETAQDHKEAEPKVNVDPTIESKEGSGANDECLNGANDKVNSEVDAGDDTGEKTTSEVESSEKTDSEHEADSKASASPKDEPDSRTDIDARPKAEARSSDDDFHHDSEVANKRPRTDQC